MCSSVGLVPGGQEMITQLGPLASFTPSQQPLESSLYDHLSLALAPLVGALAGCSSVRAEQVLDHHSLWE